MTRESALFLENMFNNDRDHEYMTLERATEDLECFAEEGEEIPCDLTPELYMETWNKLVDSWNEFWSSTTIRYNEQIL